MPVKGVKGVSIGKREVGTIDTLILTLFVCQTMMMVPLRNETELRYKSHVQTSLQRFRIIFIFIRSAFVTQKILLWSIMSVRISG